MTLFDSKDDAGLAIACEFEFVEAEGVVQAFPFDGVGNATCGEDWGEAIMMAADILRGVGEELLARSEAAPEATFGHEARRGGRVIAVATTVRRADIPAVTAAEAARQLGVSSARVSQLCSAGALDSWRVGATRMVSVESIEYRRSLDLRAGRPVDAAKAARRALACG